MEVNKHSNETENLRRSCCQDISCVVRRKIAKIRSCGPCLMLTETQVFPLTILKKGLSQALSTWLQVGMHLIAQDAKKIE